MSIFTLVKLCFSENVYGTPKRHSSHTDEATQDDIKSMNALMTANDWRDRNKGVTKLLEICESRSEMVAANVIKVCSIRGLTIHCKVNFSLIMSV